MGEEKSKDIAPEVFLGFAGNHPVRMDSAQRIPVPAKFKEALEKLFPYASNQVVLLPDFGKVKVLPVPVWEKLKAQLEALPGFDPSSDELKTFMFGNLAVCGLDSQNRIRLTPTLVQLAELERDVVVVGQQDRMEIWSAEKWNEFNANTARNLRATMAEVFRNQQQVGQSRP